MSSDDLMISVRDLGKAYTIAHRSDRATTLAEAAVRKLRTPFFRPSEKETFWALRDISFDVKRGDVVGVIGRNGAGKSTLFKVLSRIAEPSTGQVDLYGRVGSLLEVGTGFSGELTGRENIFLNGTILGMRRTEIAKRFDEIVDFAGVSKFLDTPVKRYSSGMYVRLAFAVAAHLDPEILIVDEVLSVGDAEFQAKCLGRIRDVARGGRTVLFVSHNMPSVKQLCTSAIVLKRGELTYAGDVQHGIDIYSDQEISGLDPNADANPERRSGSGEYRFQSISATQPVFKPDEIKHFKLGIIRIREATRGLFIILLFRNRDGAVVARCDSRLSGIRLDGLVDKSNVLVTLRTPWFLPGDYSVDGYIDSGAGFIDQHERACHFTVTVEIPYPATAPDNAIADAPVLTDFDWRTD